MNATVDPLVSTARTLHIALDDIAAASVNADDMPHIFALLKRHGSIGKVWTMRNCDPSRFMFLTGMEGVQHGVYGVWQAHAQVGWPTTGIVTIGTVAAAAGAATAWFGKGHTGFTDETHPCEYGFDANLGFRGGWTRAQGVREDGQRHVDGTFGHSHGDSEKSLPGHDMQARNIPGYPDGPFHDPRNLNDLIADEAERWLKGQDGGYHCYVAFGAAHKPWTAPRQYVEVAGRDILTPEDWTAMIHYGGPGDSIGITDAHARETGMEPEQRKRIDGVLYRATIMHLDWRLATLVSAHLAAGGGAVMIHTDNGIGMGEPEDNVLRGYKGTPWPGGHYADLMMIVPGCRPGALDDVTLWGADIAPTFAAFHGTAMPTANGRDASPLILRGEELPMRDGDRGKTRAFTIHVEAKRGRSRNGVPGDIYRKWVQISGPWYFLWSLTEKPDGQEAERRYIWNIADDPDLANNLYGTERAENVQRGFEVRLDAYGTRWGGDGVNIGTDYLRALPPYHNDVPHTATPAEWGFEPDDDEDMTA